MKFQSRRMARTDRGRSKKDKIFCGLKFGCNILLMSKLQ